MADAGFFRGTTSEQDSRFSDKNKKLMKNMRFEKSLAEKVDMEKVNLDVIKPWVTQRITELLSGIEDEVLIGYIFELLESCRNPDPKELQIAVTGFLNGKNARVFMGELWTHLVSAQENIAGIPADFLEKKKEEIRKRKRETERIEESLRKTQSAEADSTSSRKIADIGKAQNLARRNHTEKALDAKPIPTTSDLYTNTSSMKDQENIRKSLVGYMSSAAATPCGREKPGWHSEHEKHVEISKTSIASVLLIGDSIIQGLARYPKIWNKYFSPLKALNFGLGGDRTQNVLWRVQNGEIPLNAQMIVIHVGTNNVERDNPKDIACGVASIGMIFQEHKPNSKIILTGLLPRDLQPSIKRQQVAKVNHYLKKFCRSGHIRNFFYLKPEGDWVLADGTLNTTYYFQDHLHLVEEGDEKFAKAIYDVITKVYSGIKVEMSSDSDMSDEEEDFSFHFDNQSTHINVESNVTSPRRSAKRSRSRSPRRLTSRSRRSPSPRRYSPRKRRRHRSYSRSRSPRRRRRRKYSSSRSPSPTTNKNLLELTKSSPSPPATHSRSFHKSMMQEREDSEERVKIEPADEGYMKDENSPTEYRKSDKTQNRAYRRQRSESELSDSNVKMEDRSTNDFSSSIDRKRTGESPETSRLGDRQRRRSEGRNRFSPSRRRDSSPVKSRRRRSDSFSASPPPKRRYSPNRKRRRPPVRKSLSRSVSPAHRRDSSSEERTPSPEVRKRKEREQEIRKRKAAREARERERYLSVKLREKHERRQRRRRTASLSDEGEENNETERRKKMLAEAARRVAAETSESDEKERKRSNNRRNLDIESDDERKNVKSKVREHSSDGSSSDDVNRRVVMSKQQKRRTVSPIMTKNSIKQARTVPSRKYESSEEEHKHKQSSSVKKNRKEAKRKEASLESNESEPERRDRRRVVLKNKPRRQSSSPEQYEDGSADSAVGAGDDSDQVDHKNDSDEEIVPQKESMSDMERNSADLSNNKSSSENEQPERSPEVIKPSESRRSRNKPSVRRKGRREMSSSEEESSTGESSRRHRSKKEKKARRHHKSNKSKKRKTKKRRRASSSEEDDSESEGQNSDVEHALREKALKSIKKKSSSLDDSEEEYSD